MPLAKALGLLNKGAKPMKLFTVLCMLLLGGLAFSQEKSVSHNTEQEAMIAVYRTMNDAMVKADIDTLNGILAPDFTLTHMTGYIQPKSEWLKQVRSGEMTYFSTREVNVQVLDNRLIGQAVTSANIWGMQGTWRLQLTIDMQKQGHRWLMTKAVASTF